jgi:hypothetical protein
MSSTFHARIQPQPYAAMVHSSMYRKADMGSRLSRLNTMARKPYLQTAYTETHPHTFCCLCLPLIYLCIP